jgi:hypothetical protein
MFPFKVKFCQTIEEEFSAEQIDKFLSISRDILSEKGASYFSKEGDCLKFENNIFRLSSNWNLMAYVDGGFIEVKKNLNNTTKITYGITLISIWVISSIFTIIIFLSTKNIYDALIAFSALGCLTWLVSVLRHWGFLFSIKKHIISIIIK